MSLKILATSVNSGESSSCMAAINCELKLKRGYNENLLHSEGIKLYYKQDNNTHFSHKDSNIIMR
jgi:hypothetical protein